MEERGWGLRERHAGILLREEEKENEGCRGKGETPPKTAKGRWARREHGERREGGSRNGQKDAWCSRWCEKQGEEEEEGGSPCRPADRKALQRQMGDPVLRNCRE